MATKRRILNPQGNNELGYQHTLMYGRYSKDLGEYAKEEAAKVRVIDRLRKREERFGPGFKPYGDGSCKSKCLYAFSVVWRNTFARVGEDWVFLALLGVSMALCSFAMDFCIAMCERARLWLYRDLSTHPALQYVAWVSFPTVLILFSSGFVHIVAPQAIGSGIPEMKTVLRGVVLKEYLTFRALVSKIVGLTSSLGSGLPLGKEGPFVHISSIMGSLLSKLFISFKGIYENESQSHEMLAAACAVGVACCFAAPVGGVMFSIEVTSVYFAVRNYWRGFFAAVCGAMVFRLLAVWFKDEATITALFKTNFTLEIPFDPQELFVFALIGVFSGLAGAFFVWVHRHYVTWMRKNKRMNYFLQKNRFLYPGLLTIFISSITFPLSLGQFMATEITNHEQVTELFSNFSWASGDHDIDEDRIIKHWATPNSNIFITLTIYTIATFFNTVLACTIPVPSGLFIPHFKMGAAFGRLVGECMAVWFPEGVRYGSTLSRIMPGGYAVVGAAAWAGAVTHTVSTSVIVFELTGQISHILPVMVAVLVSNAVAQALQPSIYDSIILIKKLPYLPDIVSASSDAYNIYVEDIMITDVKYIWLGATYRNIKALLENSKRLRAYPLCDSPESMILLGSVQRTELLTLLAKQMGRERRLQVAARRARRESMAQLKPDDTVRFNTERRPSRFEVTPAPDILGAQPNPGPAGSSEAGTPEVPLGPIEVAESSEVPLDIARSAEPTAPPAEPSPSINRPTLIRGGVPRKSILKKAHSFTARYSPVASPVATPYSTVTSQDSRLRLAFEAIFKKATALENRDERKKEDTYSPQNTITHGYNPQSTITSVKKVQLPKERIIDMSPEEQQAWEDEQFDTTVNFDKCRIDPAPFQLVERTSLLKVHSLFSLLGLSHAYVTALGRLVGVVALKELRTAIEGSHASSMPQDEENSPNDDYDVGGEGVMPGPSHVDYVSTITSMSSMASTCTNDSEADYPSRMSQL